MRKVPRKVILEDFCGRFGERHCDKHFVICEVSVYTKIMIGCTSKVERVLARMGSR